MGVPLVLALRPQSDAHQWVAADRYDLDPIVAVSEYIDAFGNRCQRLTAPHAPSGS